jgi:hypothetical protein
MAISKTIKLKNNFGEESTFPNAYFRVDKLEGSKHLVSITVGCYKSGELTLLYENTVSFVPDLNSSDNFITQGYQYLKTLPEFADATDC